MSLKDNNIEFLFQKQELKKNYYCYKEIGNVFYPLKTNSNELIINNLDGIFNSDDGFLISSIIHYKYLIKLNIPVSKMCLINVLSSKETVKYLYEKGVRFFVFDSFDNLSSFLSYADLKQCKISIRINTMEVFSDTLMHLGASTIECRKMLSLLKDNCKKIGISFYLQTKIKNEPKAMEKMLNYIKQNYRDIKLSFVCIAGIKKYYELDKEYLNEFKQLMDLDEVILEPGKYLVGNVFDMKTNIIRYKDVENKLIVIIKNGIYSGMLDVLLYDYKFKFYFKTKNNNYINFSNLKDNEHDYEIYMCGGSSDSGDVIGTMYINKKYKDELKVGTEILVKDVGAYFEEFFMDYGGDINKNYKVVDNNEI